MTEAEASTEVPGAGQRIGGALRTLVGAVTLVGALTWILLNLQGPHPLQDLLVGFVLGLGALVLVMPHRVSLPGRRTAMVTGVTAVVGTLAGLLVETGWMGGAYAYAITRGWPYAWLSKGGVGGDPAAARSLAEASSWQWDVVNLGVDFYIWGFAGLLVAVAINKGRFRP
ncbi:hypothetical protein [Actinoplanes sp. NPDC051494]|uniref:hypothetical protein n=1 Tax=Actinoplanes sp. NPDC051494 TaxID=3363907 RepID=UPI0037B99ED4